MINTDFLRNCPTVCYLLGAVVGVITWAIGLPVLGCWLAMFIGFIVFLLAGWLLKLIMCDAHQQGTAIAVEMPTPEEAQVLAPTELPAKKATKPVATKPARKTSAKKPTASKTIAKKSSEPKKSGAPKKASGAKKASAAKPPAQYKSAPAQIDDLKQISGVGPKLEQTLNGLGVYQYAQVANWKKADIKTIDSQLKFKGAY